MPSDPLFASMFSTQEMGEVVSGRAWVRAMLQVEAALARAKARSGLITDVVADEIASVCLESEFDPVAIGREAAAAANPVVPLVEMLRARLGHEAAAEVHRGATSQDILDTAIMLVARQAIDVLLGTIERMEANCAALAQEHRDTVMAGRTLLQQAVPITFGLKAAGWLSATMEAKELLATYRTDRLAVQLGGAAGTLAALGLAGPDVVRDMASQLDLHEPLLPWHTSRARIAELGAALGIVAGTAGKVALDIALLSQDEVGEVREGGAGRGRSSAMPQKRNPVSAVVVMACVRRAQALVPVLLGGMMQEHERAAGAWQAEWETVNELFSLTHAAVSHLATALDGLEVNAEAMRANIGVTRGLLMSESVLALLSGHMDPQDARRAVDAAAQRVRTNGTHLRDELLADSEVAARIPTDALDRALDPAAAVGAASSHIDRVLAAWGNRPRGAR
ncbi:MAG: 3-carboxy-cis,cis-muconate cycloisomerase [Tepidiformaceae bacterium]